MKDNDIEKMKHRIKIGLFKEVENENGDLICDFNPVKDVWAEINPLPLVSASPFGKYGEMNKNCLKNTYFIKIRKNVLSRGRHESINAIVWKYKILTNFYCLRPDKTGIFLEGLFYDHGREFIHG
jgi:hypothetical protein